jgi:hypothetical protein
LTRPTRCGCARAAGSRGASRPLTSYRLPRQRYRHLKSTEEIDKSFLRDGSSNLLQRLNEEIKRRIFSDQAAHPRPAHLFNAANRLRRVRALAAEMRENRLATDAA